MKRIKKYSYYLLEYGNRVCKCSTNTLGTFLSNSAPSVAGMILRSIVDTRGTLCNRFVVDDNTIEYETVEDSSESETTIDSDVKEHIRIPSSKQRYSRKNRRKC
jgi:hypothetical protein